MLPYCETSILYWSLDSPVDLARWQTALSECWAYAIFYYNSSMLQHDKPPSLSWSAFSVLKKCSSEFSGFFSVSYLPPLLIVSYRLQQTIGCVPGYTWFLWGTRGTGHPNILQRSSAKDLQILCRFLSWHEGFSENISSNMNGTVQCCVWKSNEHGNSVLSFWHKCSVQFWKRTNLIFFTLLLYPCVLTKRLINVCLENGAVNRNGYTSIAQ